MTDRIIYSSADHQLRSILFGDETEYVLESTSSFEQMIFTRDKLEQLAYSLIEYLNKDRTND